ncbi:MULTISPECIES: hypothetical protein [Methylobacterium]|uniref:Uncharacterized protein n=2 Tax=Methylobacterium TaxID=407 RepID=A0A0C6FFX1_9HYPH|nr:hypothetical protein [Methylobacterium aquaticum]QRE77183.1 hypothetical protein F1D61_29855 [Methylobacterium aquaticum]BAQ45912.1 hypothetical protein Maq22A_c13490 [Methylobacterium aquaticum]
MTIHLGLWAFPILATLALLGWAFLMPMPRPQGGAYDFGGLLTAGFRAAVVLVGTLVAWLVWALVR